MAALTPRSLFLSVGVLLLLHSAQVVAFGAGNIASISAIEGQNWRHGDIEDTLLNIVLARVAGGKKFSKMDVKRVYFGNWLRDYSQAVDVGAVKYVSAEAVRLLLWVLGFMSFGFGSGPFEVTRDRLGCYRPEEHIDNPKDYADNIDARDYDRRLRAPVDERRELSVDERNGLKNYIATEDIGITTSAGLVRNLYGRAIDLGRQYARSKRKEDLYEAFRLLGTANHCLEDYSAHSNYVELALIELGERDVFPHVGRSTQIQLQGARHPVYPIVTGTFGGTDFLHSVMGELSDKATQSEIQELEGTISGAQSNENDFSLLKDLLSKVPEGLFGGKDEAGKADELQTNAQAAQMTHTHISPREPEEWATAIGETFKEIYPIIEWHDEIMQSINEMIESIPILPELLEQLTEQVNVFVFSLIAPFVLPIIRQVKNELATGSSEIIESSRQAQHVVFHDDSCTDPTHSMLSKDHFSNILNEPAGKVSSQVLKWVIPQIMACWDDENIDIERTLNRIINGVFHHPALANYGEDGASDGRRGMFTVVEQWWNSKDEGEKDFMRDQLSRDGVEQGRNHKEGVHDGGHGCGKPLGLPNYKTAGSSGAVGGVPLNILGEIGDALEGKSKYDSGAQQGGGSSGGKIGDFAGEAVGGGALGGIVGGLASSLLGGALGDSDKKESRQSESYGRDGSHTQSYSQSGYGRSSGGGDTYGEANYSRTNYPSGGQRDEYRREEHQTSSGYGSGGYGGGGGGYSGGGGGGGGGGGEYSSGGYGGGGYEQRSETRFESSGGYQSEIRQEYRQETSNYGESSYQERRRSRSGSNRSQERHQRRRDSNDSDERRGGSYGQEQSYGQRRRSNDSDERRGGGYGSSESQGYGGYERQRRGSNDSNDNDNYRRRRGSNDSNDNDNYRRRRGSNDDERQEGYGGGGYEGGYGRNY